MIRNFAVGVALIFVAVTASAGPKNIMEALPWVGTLEEINVAERTLVLLGPDGIEKHLRVPEKTRPLRQFNGPSTLAEVAKLNGVEVAIFLRDAETVHGMWVIEEPGPLLQARLLGVDEQIQKIAFGESGIVTKCKPAVNLGAVSAPGEAPGSADWAWFKERVDQFFEVRTVTVFGMTFIWSIEPWNPGGDAGQDGAEEN